MKNKRLITTLLSLIFVSSLLTACGSWATQKQAALSAPAESAVLAPTPSGAVSQSVQTITVNSTEMVSVTPDIAEIVYAVRTESKEAADCQLKNTENVNKVIETLKEFGIEEKSIQTSDYTMYPIYDYSGNTQKLEGYEASSVLTVSDISIDKVGDILAQSVISGINNVQSISYQSSSYDTSYHEALKLAVGSAYTKAQALAEASGCTVGGVVKITENSNYSQARYNDTALASKANGTAKEFAVEDAATLMPGEIDVEVNITVEYQILSNQ